MQNFNASADEIWDRMARNREQRNTQPQLTAFPIKVRPPSITPENARKGNIVLVTRGDFACEGIIIEYGSVCDGLFQGIHYVDLGRDAAHYVSFAVARELIQCGYLYITEDIPADKDEL